MPFLNKAILIELLKTYPGAKKIEAKYKSLISDYKEDTVSVQQRLSDGSNTLFNFSIGMFGYNTPDKSEGVYLELHSLIDDAIRHNKINLWPEIICKAGEGGYHTFSNSISDSKLARVAFALLMFIRNQVDSKVKVIEDKIRAVEEKPRSIDTKPKSIEEKMRLYRDKIFLDADEELAFQIYLAINERIDKEKEVIKKLNDVLKLIKELEFNTVYAGKVEINTTIGQEFNKWAAKQIEIAQRQLFFLGDDSIKKDPNLKKSAQDLFGKFEFYSNQLRKDYSLTDDQIAGLNNLLPIMLQPIYPSLYISDHFKDLKHKVKEGTVIESFEHLVLIDMANKQTKMQVNDTRAHESKEPAQTPVSQSKIDLIIDTGPLSPPPLIVAQQGDVTKAFNQESPTSAKSEQTPVEPNHASDHAVSDVSSSQVVTAGIFKTTSNKQPIQDPASELAADDENALIF